MEHQKILNLFNQASDSISVTRKWNIANDQSNVNYDAGYEIIHKTEANIIFVVTIDSCIFSKG